MGASGPLHLLRMALSTLDHSSSSALALAQSSSSSGVGRLTLRAMASSIFFDARFVVGPSARPPQVSPGDDHRMPSIKRVRLSKRWPL
jgi:hypothetical protein